jgi:phosphoglycolate phosphatase
MRRFNNILFDLDGTLIDPGTGIAGTIQFVLDTLGLASRFDDRVAWYVGPPLTEIFRRVLPLGSREDLTGRAVLLYIERFATHGAQESTVYPGITEALAELRINRHLFRVTSKTPPLRSRS